MNLGEIVTEVRILLKDQRADVLASIPDYVNEAYEWVAAEKSLPSLKAIFTVNTVLDQAYANAPTTFDGRLLYCGTADGALTVLNGGLEELLEKHPDTTVEGVVEDIACEGSIIWYAPIPTEVTALICLGYNKPTLLTANTDTPSALPDYLHREILVNKAAAIGFDIIEDGLDTEKANTIFYEGKVAVGINKLATWLDLRKGHVPRGIWSV